MHQYHSCVMSTMDYPITIVDQLSTHLRSLRQSKGITQKDLAKMLGVTQSRVAAIERHPGAVSAGQLFEIIRTLGASIVIRDSATTGDATRQVNMPTTGNDDQGGDW